MRKYRLLMPILLGLVAIAGYLSYPVAYLDYRSLLSHGLAEESVPREESELCVMFA